MTDLDEILGAVHGPEGEPCLVEVGRGLQAGVVRAVAYRWSTGRIRATVEGGRVCIGRVLGSFPLEKRDRVDLSPEDLRRLSLACLDWKANREEWAAFYSSCAGFPAGYGGAQYFQEPGPRGERVQVHRRVLGKEWGTPLQGRVEVRPLPEARPLDRGVVVTVELWRVGERYGPTGGSMIGLRYSLGPDLQLDTERHGAVLTREPADAICLEPGEEAFVTSLSELPALRMGRAPTAPLP